MTIDEICEYAKENGHDSLKFEFINLRGETIKLQWLDAYMGIFKLVDDDSNFISVSTWKQVVTDNFDFKLSKNE